MTSAVWCVLSSGFVHANLEVSLISPRAAPAVSSNPELFTPWVLKSFGFGLAESYYCHRMVNRLLFITALSSIFSKNATSISPKSFSDDNSDANRLFGDKSLEIFIWHVSFLNHSSVFEHWLGFIKLAGSLDTSVRVISLSHQTILGSVSVGLRGPAAIISIISEVTIYQLLHTEICPILTAIFNGLKCLEGGDSGEGPWWGILVGELICCFSYDSLFSPVFVVR